MSDYIPHSLVEKILLKLPIISLLRFTSVSKSWLFLIQTNSFIHSHLKQTASSILVCISTNTLSAPWSLTNFTHSPSPIITTVEPPFPAHLSSLFRFIQSVYGLVCFFQKSVIVQQVIILWNPSIRRHFTLQIPPLQDIVALGFGFDSIKNDFKLIKLFNPGHQVEIFSLNEGAWRAIHIDSSLQLELGVVRFSDTQCFMNGNVHWIVERNTQVRPKVLLLKFDVEEEKFRMMMLPRKLVKVRISRLEVTVIEGCLSVLVYNAESPFQDANSWCNIWMMREYDVVESWIKIGKVHLPDGGRVFGASTCSNVFVNWSNWSGTQFSSLHSLDPNTQEIMDIGIPGRAIIACDYSGSLVLLNRT